jgi:catechol 2,3-dioxygenase-like lactoylglutathione lyase family enzyme
MNRADQEGPIRVHITARRMVAPERVHVKALMSVMFNVKDVDRSVAFYRSLGFTTRWKWKGEDGALLYAGVGIGEAVIALGKITVGGGGGQYRGYRKWVGSNLGGGVIVNVEVRNVERVYARAKKARVTIESRLRKWPYGTAFTINDPDGYVVKFLHPVGEFA